MHVGVDETRQDGLPLSLHEFDGWAADLNSARLIDGGDPASGEQNVLLPLGLRAKKGAASDQRKHRLLLNRGLDISRPEARVKHARMHLFM
jgi:hypothetical protein